MRGLEKNFRANANRAHQRALCRLAAHLRAFFGNPRQHGSSHAIYKTPWPGNPRVNIQNDKGKAKAYQVGQVLLAIERLGAKP